MDDEWTGPPSLAAAPGADVIITGCLSDEDAKKAYPEGWRAARRISASSRSRAV
jgi:hypothetical protein